jgi:hypothetical protein
MWWRLRHILLHYFSRRSYCLVCDVILTETWTEEAWLVYIALAGIGFDLALLAANL